MKTLAFSLIFALFACGDAWAAKTYYVDGSEGQAYATEHGWADKATDKIVHRTIAEALTPEVSYSDIWVAPGDYEWTGIVTNSQRGVRLLAADGDPANTRLVGRGSQDPAVSDCLAVTMNANGGIIAGFTITNFVSYVKNPCVRAGDISNCVIQCCSAVSNFVLYADRATSVQVMNCRSEEISLARLRTQDQGTVTSYKDCSFFTNTVQSSRVTQMTDPLDYHVGIVQCYHNCIYTRFSFIGNRVSITPPTGSTSLPGAGACFQYGMGVKVYNCLFVDNHSHSSADKEPCRYMTGGIGSTISNCVIVATTLPIGGGTIHHTVVSNCVGRSISNADGKTYNSLFANNVRTNVISSLDYAMFQGEYYNCTIANNTNTANDYGMTWTKTGVIKNCIFSGNYPYDFETLPKNAYNTLYGSANEKQVNDAKLFDCIKTDNPKFNLGAKPELPYYAVRRGSPAIDKGDATLNNNLIWEFDLAGNPRIYQPEGGNATPIDIGCYEWFPTNDGFILIIR